MLPTFQPNLNEKAHIPKMAVHSDDAMGPPPSPPFKNQPSSTVVVTVATYDNRAEIRVLAHIDDPIWSVKTKVAHSMQVSPTRLSFDLGGLEEWHTLRNCGVRNGATLRLASPSTSLPVAGQKLESEEGSAAQEKPFSRGPAVDSGRNSFKESVANENQDNMYDTSSRGLRDISQQAATQNQGLVPPVATIVTTDPGPVQRAAVVDMLVDDDTIMEECPAGSLDGADFCSPAPLSFQSPARRILTPKSRRPKSTRKGLTKPKSSAEIEQNALHFTVLEIWIRTCPESPVISLIVSPLETVLMLKEEIYTRYGYLPASQELHWYADIPEPMKDEDILGHFVAGTSGGRYEVWVEV